jgi:hypothetical protein
VTLKEEYRLRVVENIALRRIFGPKRYVMTGGWRKLHNNELRNLYSSSSLTRIIKSRRIHWTGHIARMKKKNAYRLLVGRPEEKRLLGRPRCKGANSIKIDLEKKEWGGLD